MADGPPDFPVAGEEEPSAVDSLELIARLIRTRVGLLYEDARRPLLESRVRELMAARRVPSMADMACRLMQPQDDEELWGDLLARIVTRESSWFRQSEHFDVLRDFILPSIVSNKGFDGHDTVRILSAGCSLGQEPYSLAILLEEVAEHYAEEQMRFVVEACDVDEDALQYAKAGSYSEPELRGLTASRRMRYFDQSGDKFRVKPMLRQKVRFFRQNLLDPLHTQPYDVVFCRNVTIYFAPPTTERVVNNLAGVLSPGGHLFPGPAETWRGLKTELKPVQFGTSTVHRRTRARSRAEESR